MAKTWNQRLRSIVGSAFGADVVELNLEKAIRDAEQKAVLTQKPVSQFWDPYTLFMGREWLYRAKSVLTFEDLRAMSRSPIIAAIIQTRLNQVAAFCSPSAFTGDYGFKVTMMGDATAKEPDKLNAAIVREATDWLSTAGQIGFGDKTLEDFARKFIRDSLTLDQACAEIVPRLDKLPSYLAAVDGATIRRTAQSLVFNSPATEVFYVQVIDETKRAEYNKAQLIFGIRNPQTDIRANGYGMSELEYLINLITIMANAEKYNSSQLAQGGIQKGVLIVKGEVDKMEIQSFRRDFRQAIQTAATGWRPPVLHIGTGAEVDWQELDRSNKDMEYAQLFEFVVKLSTAVYQISPAEINWNISSGSRVSFQGSQKDVLNYSQDKGLRPLLKFFANQMNQPLVLFNPDLRMEFDGLAKSSATEEADLRMREVTSYKTLNEVRKEANLPELKGGDIVLNPIYAGVVNPPEQPPAGGQPGAEGEPAKKEEGKFEFDPSHPDYDPFLDPNSPDYDKEYAEAFGKAIREIGWSSRVRH